MKALNASLQGKTIVITGATSGIGLAAAGILASKGARVLGSGRSPERCREARQSILTRFPDAQVEYLVADLASQEQVNSLAQAIGAVTARVDVLVNNAGTVSRWFQETEDGHEMQFAVNYLAPFLLTFRLMPRLLASTDRCVINLSSFSHYNTRIHWKDVMFRRSYFILSAYKQSKLANVLLAAELNRRYGAQGLRAFAVDPGLVNTEIAAKNTRGIVDLIWKVLRRTALTPEQGAETIVFLASQPGLSPAGQFYWTNNRPKRPNPLAEKPEEGARLWALSEKLCGLA